MPDIHRKVIGSILLLIGIIFCLILVRIYGRFSNVEVDTWQQVIFTIMVAIAMLQVATSICILFNRPWPVKICIFIAAFNLVIFPIGTFAGIYYFWYFLKSSYPHRKRIDNIS